MKYFIIYIAIRCVTNKNTLKFKCFKPRGVRILKHVKNGLRAKFKCLKVILSWYIDRKYVRCFIAVKHFKKFD